MRTLLAATVLLLLTATPGLAETPGAALARLRSIGVAVALPGTIPPGFALTRVIKPKAWGGPAFGSGYVALYEGPMGVGFAVESAGADLGGGEGAWHTQPSATVRSDWFGQNVGLYWRGPRQNVAPSWVSDWIEGPGQFYRFIGPAHVRNDHGVSWPVSREVSQQWAETIVGSIRIPGAPPRARLSPSAMPTPFITDFTQP